MQARPATKEEIAKVHLEMRRQHEAKCGPMLIAMHDRLTASQRVAYFDPIYNPAAMNNFKYRRAFEPTGGVFADKGVLTYFFCIVEAGLHWPCWVVRLQIGEGKVKDEKGKVHFEKMGKVRPAMVQTLDDLANSMLEGCGRVSNYKLSDDKQTYYVYRAFTEHERKLAFPPFLATRGVNIGPVSMMSRPVEEKKLIVDG